jgi:hypothetical protein
MSLISLVAILIMGGVLVWVIEGCIPMNGKTRRTLNLLLVICIAAWLFLVAFGIFHHSGSLPVSPAQ